MSGCDGQVAGDGVNLPFLKCGGGENSHSFCRFAPSNLAKSALNAPQPRFLSSFFFMLCTHCKETRDEQAIVQEPLNNSRE